MPRPARVPWAALSVGAICVPALTVVALTEEPQALVRRPKVPSAAGSAGSSSGSSSSGAGDPWWLPLAQQLERLQQLTGGSPDDDELDGEAEGVLQEEQDGQETGGLGSEAAAEEASLGATGTAGSSPAAAGSSSWEQPRRRTWPRQGSRDVPASRLAAERQQDMAEMRRLAEAELARLAAAAMASAPGGAAQRSGPPPTRAQPQPAALPLPPRFTDAELMRFAMMHGLLRATTPAQRLAALREGAAAAARTARWLGEHPFSSEDELERFAHLVSWQGTDEQGHPVLHISIGRAVAECRGAAALAFSNAVITHMEQGLARRLVDWVPPAGAGGGRGGAPGAAARGGGSDVVASAGGGGSGAGSANSADSSDVGAAGGRDGGAGAPGSSPPGRSGGRVAAAQQAAAAAAKPAEQVVVVMDCSGASTLSAARISWVFQAVASSLSHHYPGRLHELVLLDLPVVLGWMVSGIKAMVHPETRHKFRVVSPRGEGHAAEPHPAAAAQAGRPGAAPPRPQAARQGQQGQAPQPEEHIGQQQQQLAPPAQPPGQAGQASEALRAAPAGGLVQGGTREQPPPLPQLQTQQRGKPGQQPAAVQLHASASCHQAAGDLPLQPELAQQAGAGQAAWSSGTA